MHILTYTIHLCHYIVLFSLLLIIQQGLPMLLFAPLAFYLQRRRENIAWTIRARVWGHTDQQNPKVSDSKVTSQHTDPCLYTLKFIDIKKNEHCQIKSCSVAWSYVVQQKADIKLFTFWEGDKEVAGRYSCSVQTSSRRSSWKRLKTKCFVCTTRKTRGQHQWGPW